MEIRLGAHEFIVVTANDLYGEEWWKRVEGGYWEPSTFGWVESKAVRDSFFLDLGAASGLLSMIAAQNGATVIAVEPHPQWIDVLTENIALNNLKITAVKKAVAENDGVVNFSVAPNRRVMTDISRPSTSSYEITEIKTISLPTLLLFKPEAAKRTILKMDIEGIEYVLLKDRNNLNLLSDIRAEILVSLHPGFIYTNENIFPIYQPLSHRWAKMRGFIDTFILFTRLRKFAQVTLVNGEPCRSPLKASLLSFLGSNDFVLNFAPNRGAA